VEELEHRRYTVCWDSMELDGESWIPLIKLFAIRMAYMMVSVHMKKHPDEI
jgi:hypothetical protein